MSKVLIPLADGVEELEAIAAIDVLRRGGVEVITAALGASEEIRGAHAVKIMADARLSAVIDDEYDAILLPGGGEGTENLKNCDALIRRLCRQRDSGGLLAAICAAPTVLDEAGLLDPEQQVTCYPTCQMDISCVWVNHPVVDHNGMVTSQGPGTAVLFALVVLSALEGEGVAKKVARGMVFEF